MKPIINPWLIYLIDLVDKFQVIINIALVVLGFTIICLGIACFCFQWSMIKMIALLLLVKNI